MSLFVDANIPMYAEGRDHRLKAPSAEFMLAIARCQVDAVSDVEVLQEILHRYRAVGRQSDGFVVFQTFATAIRLFHSIVPDDLWECRAIMRRHPGVQPRDAIHVAVMRRNRIRTVVSYDRDFDGFPDIQRVTPDEVL